MSQHVFEARNVEDKRMTVMLGYDRPLDFVFCTVSNDENELLYCNLDDPNAGTDQQDVNYYRPLLKQLGIVIPEAMFREVVSDQLWRRGNRLKVHSDSDRSG